MSYSVRAGFAVVNDETLEVEEYHDTQEEALAHQAKLAEAEADPTGSVAAEIIAMRAMRKRKKVAPRPKGGQYNEPSFVAFDTGKEVTGVTFVPISEEA